MTLRLLFKLKMHEKLHKIITSQKYTHRLDYYSEFVLLKLRSSLTHIINISSVKVVNITNERKKNIWEEC